MMRMCLAIMVLVLPVGVAAAQSETDEQLSGGQDRYDVLFERSIFSRTRGEPSSPQRRTEPPTRRVDPPPPRDPGAGMVLRGIAMHAGQAVAMIEDTDDRDAALHQVREGDLVAGRRVVGITLDHLKLERDQQRHTVSPGMTLTGEHATRPTSERREGSGDGGASPRTQSVLERMRQRRAQQLGESSPSPRQPDPEPDRERDREFDRELDRDPEPDESEDHAADGFDDVDGPEDPDAPDEPDAAHGVDDDDA
ncbi:MAG: hypothetical protein WD118_03125 [Phycisphaeraceae bacterium]